MVFSPNKFQLFHKPFLTRFFYLRGIGVLKSKLKDILLVNNCLRIMEVWKLAILGNLTLDIICAIKT